MKAARACTRHAVVLALVFLALTPTAALAFTPPAPGNPGRHLGELLHNPHLQVATPGGGGQGTGTGPSGITNALSTVTGGGPSEPSIDFPAFQLASASGGGFSSLTAESTVGRDSVLVVAILAALIAANVVLAVVYVARGGNFLIRQVLQPVPAAA